jgi:hypothetical protein
MQAQQGLGLGAVKGDGGGNTNERRDFCVAPTYINSLNNKRFLVERT